ncbi:MAG: hypothetical protein ACP5JJ_03840 [Anaerolineae bacterium]
MTWLFSMVAKAVEDLALIPGNAEVMSAVACHLLQGEGYEVGVGSRALVASLAGNDVGLADEVGLAEQDQEVDLLGQPLLSPSVAELVVQSAAHGAAPVVTTPSLLGSRMLHLGIRRSSMFRVQPTLNS